MDGGIDALYTQRFGRAAQGRLQEQIRSRHGGELLVGLAEIVETDNVMFPFCIAAPTLGTEVGGVGPNTCARQAREPLRKSSSAALLFRRHGRTHRPVTSSSIPIACAIFSRSRSRKHSLEDPYGFIFRKALVIFENTVS